MDADRELLRKLNILEQKVARLMAQEPGAGLTDVDATFSADLTVLGTLTAGAFGYSGASYTPSWTATTTNPSIGNGTIVGRYVRFGPLCLLSVRLTFGSTTTYGSGSWRLSLPIPPASLSIIPLGSAYGNNAGVANYVFGARIITTSLMEFPVNGATYVDAVSPFTWGPGDTFGVSIVYEV